MAGDPFHERLSELGPALLNALAAFEEVRRRLDPPQIPGLRDAVQPIAARLHAALAAFAATPAPGGLGDLAAQLRQSAEAADAALELFCGDASPAQAIPRVLRAMHEHCRAQALLYPLRRVLPPVSRFFFEPAVRDRAAALDADPRPDTPTGIITARQKDGARGGFSLYVPEYYDAARAWPLIVALHGGSGTGDDFLWTWLTEARSRGCLLMSPTSLGSTWSLMDEDVDAYLAQSAQQTPLWTMRRSLIERLMRPAPGEQFNEQLRQQGYSRPGKAVAQIPDLSNWEATARIGELDRGHIGVGQHAELSVVAAPGKKLLGKIKTIGGTAGPPWDRHFDCRVAIENLALACGSGSGLFVGILRLDGPEQFLVPLNRRIGIVAALQEQLVAADGDRLVDLAEDLLEAEDVAFVGADVAVERAEVALRHADVGVVHVAIDDVCDDAVGVFLQADAVGQLAEQCGGRPAIQIERLVTGDALTVPNLLRQPLDHG
jgi:hypothetical protein